MLIESLTIESISEFIERRWLCHFLPHGPTLATDIFFTLIKSPDTDSGPRRSYLHSGCYLMTELIVFRIVPGRPQALPDR